MKLLILILTLLAFPAFAAPISINEAGCPSQMLDIQGGQLVCFTAPPPPVDSDGDGVFDADDDCPTEAGPASNNGCPEAPPPPTAACPVAPRLNDYGPVIWNSYFYDCGEPTQLRSPEPSSTYWHISGNPDGQGSSFSLCILEGSYDSEQLYPGGHVTIGTSDQRIVMAEDITGTFRINGSRLSIATMAGTQIPQPICGSNAHNVEINGECVCP